jgi:hypothetical protein
MKQREVTLRCDACGKKFNANKMPDGGWRTIFPRQPPSSTCRSHRHSPLCRWEVHKARLKLWRQVAVFVEGRPVTFVTLVPPHRTVAFDQVAEVSVANELRAVTRPLAARIPPNVIVIGYFDISLRDDQSGDERERFWVPHFHLLVIGLSPGDTRHILSDVYQGNEAVLRPIRVQKAPSPRAALSYSIKHVNDIDAGVLLPRQPGCGLRGPIRRGLKADEKAAITRFALSRKLGDMLLLMGVRRFGQKLRRVQVVPLR